MQHFFFVIKKQMIITQSREQKEVKTACQHQEELSGDMILSHQSHGAILICYWLFSSKEKDHFLFASDHGTSSLSFIVNILMAEVWDNME